MQYVFFWASEAPTQGPPRAAHTLTTPLSLGGSTLAVDTQLYLRMSCNVDAADFSGTASVVLMVEMSRQV